MLALALTFLLIVILKSEKQDDMSLVTAIFLRIKHGITLLASIDCTLKFSKITYNTGFGYFYVLQLLFVP